MGVAFGETRSNGGSSFGGDRGRDRQAQAQFSAAVSSPVRWIASGCWGPAPTVSLRAMAGASAVPAWKAAIAAAVPVRR
ncbi:hypothetical protein G6F24_018649 [Rhizopus arrhizus]|nr:hypothetical protein G6F24_018649 [Rhizopus arrhizus]